MIVRLNIGVKYEGVWHEPGEKIELPDDVGQSLTGSGQAKFVGFRCPFCPDVISGDSVKQAKKKLGGHIAGHKKRKARDEKRRDKEKKAKK